MQHYGIVQPLNDRIQIVLQDEITYKLLKIIEDEPRLSQRDIAQKMGISLGKVNYCLKALVDKGLIKIQNFCMNKKKNTYLYLLTPQGIEEKTQVTYRFLQRKIAEFETIKAEINSLKNEVSIKENYRGIGGDVE